MQEGNHEKRMVELDIEDREREELQRAYNNVSEEELIRMSIKWKKKEIWIGFRYLPLKL